MALRPEELNSFTNMSDCFLKWVDWLFISILQARIDSDIRHLDL